MIRYLKSFFSPPVSIYSYNQSKEIAIAKISEVFKKKVTLLGSRDITGRLLSNDTFTLDVVSLAYTKGVKYSSTLEGQIVQTGNETIIKIKARPSSVLYTLFFGSIILGVVYLVKFMHTNLNGFLIWSLVMLIVGPILIVWFSNVANYSILERYLIYIDKELRA